jgi:hypothetical protein
MRFAVVVFAAALTTACANPAQFAPAVETLATATKAAQSAMVDSDALAGAALNRAMLRHALENPRSIEIRDGECEPESPRCSFWVSGKGRSVDLTQPAASIIPNQLAAMAALVEYTQALERLVVAPDKAALDDVNAKVTDAIKKVAALAQLTPTFGVFAEPIGQAIAWVIGEAQDQARMSALRTATANMQSVIEKAAPIFDRQVERNYRTHIQDMRAEFNEKREAFGNAIKTPAQPNNASIEAIKAYLSAASNLNAALVGRPDGMFAKVASAHAALKDAVHNPYSDRAALMRAVSDLADELKRGAALLRKLRDSSHVSAS